MKQAFTIVLFLFLSGAAAFGQGQIDNQSKIALRNELTGAFYVGSSGYGLNMAYGKRIDGFRKRLFMLELAEIKHSKETKTSNPYLPNNNRFVYGKLNNFYALRGGVWGLQKEIFSKRDKNSISIRYYYVLGPSIGILKPVYYEVIENISYFTEIVEKKFDPDKHMRANIVGRASYFKGFDELTLSVGGFAKAGFMFEFSQFDRTVKAIELGAYADTYLKAMPIMATDQSDYNFLSKIEENRHIFIGFYAGFRIGKTIEAMGFQGQL